MGQALVVHEPNVAGEAAQYLTFLVGRGLYAIPLERVREVVELHGITRIPLSSPVVPGVLNLRGAVVPVIDLSLRFSGPSTVIGRRTCVVVVEVEIESNIEPIGVIVDAVSEALEVEPSQLERRPAFGAGLRSDFVAGMLNLAGRFVPVLEVDQVLSMVELEQLVATCCVEDASRAGLGRERSG